MSSFYFPVNFREQITYGKMKIDYNLIKRYLEDKGIEQDKRIIINWFKRLTGEKELRAKSFQYWNEMPENVNIENYDETLILGYIYRKIKLDEFRNKNKVSTPKIIINYLSKIAAILFIPILILCITNYNTRKLTGSKTTYTEIYSPPNSRTIFYLPDGSKGWLNGGSYIKFPQRFSGKTRNVSLRGEAFFNVVTNPDIPFIVTCKNLNIMAKGTSFNVCAWEDEHDVKIVLVNGKLEIYQGKKHNKTLVNTLEPGQLYYFSLTGAGSYVRDVNVAKHISWTEGKMIFKDDQFTNVVKRINRWYNVECVIKDDILKSYTYVATFQNESLDEILKMLKISAPIDYKNNTRKQQNDGTFEKRRIDLYYKPKNK